jgi:hypothetical protein
VAEVSSTGTLVLVALAGGGGALLGAILGQAVQLHRDRKQYEREDARHERERREALEDERAGRREDRYVTLLTELTRLDRQLQEYLRLIDLYVKQRREVDTPRPRRDEMDPEDLDPGHLMVGFLAERIARQGLDSWEGVVAGHKDVTTAFYAAYAVASTAVRKAGLPVIGWSTHATFDALTQSGADVPIFDEANPRFGTREEFVAHVTGDFGVMRGHIADLDRLLREELPLA